MSGLVRLLLYITCRVSGHFNDSDRDGKIPYSCTCNVDKVAMSHVLTVGHQQFLYCCCSKNILHAARFTRFVQHSTQP